jgi:ATP-binding cassette subfamily D (ALD) protein 3
VGGAGAYGVAKYLKYKKQIEKEANQRVKKANEDETPKKRSGKLDSVFFNRLQRLLAIVVPSLKSIEVLQLIALVLVVVSRTFVSNWLSSISGDISKTLIDLDFRNFCLSLGLSSSLSFVSALLAPTLKYLTGKLSLEWRIALTKHIHKKYLTNMMYYKTAYLTNQVTNPDQIITQDVEKFCDGVTSLFANLVKPIADVLLYTYKLVTIAGYGGPIAILTYMLFSFFVVTVLRPPFSAMTSKFQNLEGNFRYCHIRTATNGESIAFYGGDELEKSIANQSFDEVYQHKKKLIKTHFLFGIFNDLFVFNLPQSVSWIIAMMPVFFGRLRNASRGELAQVLRYLAAVVSHEFQAIGEIIHLQTRLTEIAGYTTNIGKLMEVIDRLEHEQKGKGKMVDSPNSLVFDNVKLVTPDGTLLAENIKFTIKQGQNLLVTGPNGAGKTSLFRILGGLWPLEEGIVGKPFGDNNTSGQLHNEIYYVPQKPYNAVGTLRENIVYPLTTEQAKNCSDAELTELLKKVQLEHLVEREGGFNLAKNWDDILSLGEQQRLSMARLFYHKPKFAILDDCTSAVSAKGERELYTLARDLNITLITISIRTALKDFHQWEISFDDPSKIALRELH